MNPTKVMQFMKFSKFLINIIVNATGATLFHIDFPMNLNFFS